MKLIRTYFDFQLWNELCDLVAKNPDKVTSLKIEPIIRQGLKRYTDQIGVLWNSMADYYIRGGHFERVSVTCQDIEQIPGICICINFANFYLNV